MRIYLQKSQSTQVWGLVSLALATGLVLVIIAASVSHSASTASSQVMYSSWPAPAVGVVIDKDLKVVEVEKGGAAEEAGLQPGDKLESFDGVPFDSANSPRQVVQGKIGEMLQQNGKASEVPLVVTRAGQTVTLKIKPRAPQGSAGPTPTPVPQHQSYF